MTPPHRGRALIRHHAQSTFKQAVGDKRSRLVIPMCRLDEAAVARRGRSSRPSGRLEFCAATRAMISCFDVDLTHEFFRGFVNHALVTLHARQSARRQRSPSV